MFKCVHGLNPEYLNSLFESKEIPYDLKDPYKLKQKKWFTKQYGYKSFTYYGAKLWNAIPGNIKIETDLSIFKKVSVDNRIV